MKPSLLPFEFKQDQKRLASIYNIYYKIKDRCNNPKAKDYKFYGAKGVTISEEWNTIRKFMTWMVENKYQIGLTVDRIDGKKGYAPDNCRLVTIQENLKNRYNIRTFFDTQTARCRTCRKIKSFNEFHKSSRGVNVNCKECRNATRRKSLFPREKFTLTYNGETKTIIEWSRITGIKYCTIVWRIKNNFTYDNILSI